MSNLTRAVWTVVAAMTVLLNTHFAMAMIGGGSGDGPAFTDGQITVSGGSTWETPTGSESDVATGSFTIEPALVEGSGTTSGAPVAIEGEIVVNGTISSVEGLFSQYVVDFYVSEAAIIGPGVTGVVDVQLDGDIGLSIDQPYAFEIVHRGRAAISVVPDPASPNPGEIVDDLLMPGAYRISIATAIVQAETGEQFKFTSWLMLLTAQQGPNEPPVCPDGVSIELWPPNHQYVPIDLNELAGVIDPDDDPIEYTITTITQDEPSNSTGDGDTTCDGAGGSAVAMVRAERKGNGDGRVYHINYIADDGNGGTCEGVLLVTVPHSASQPAVDSGQDYVSSECVSPADIDFDGAVSVDDLLWVINTWGSTGPDETLNWPDADTNIDGIVDVTDLLSVINNWGDA